MADEEVPADDRKGRTLEQGMLGDSDRSVDTEVCWDKLTETTALQAANDRLPLD